MIWLLDTNTVAYLVNQAPGVERIKRRLSGRSPGEVRLSAISLSELHYGLARGDVSVQRREALDELLALFELEDYPEIGRAHV